MPSSKICSCFIASLLLTFALAGAAFAQAETPVKIVVLPFDVNAEEDLRYLEDSLPELLGDRLKEAGFELVSGDVAEQVMAEQGITTIDIAAARQVAVASGASYALYGTFSQLGDALSMEGRFVEAFGLEPALPIFSNKNGLINLLPMVDELVGQMRASAYSQDTIASIDVEGTKILDKDVVLIRLNMNKGDDYTPKAINDEMKTIYDLGYFDDVKADVTDVAGGKRVVFTVVEKPRIQSLGVIGNDVLDTDEIIQIVSSKTGAVLNPKVLRLDMATIRAYYKNEGYYQTKVSYEVEGGETGQAKLNFIVEEGKKLYIKEIVFDGAEQLDPDDLKDELALTEEWMFSWLDSSGVLNEEMLDRDASSIQAYYSNRGFLNVKVARPEVDFREDGIYVTFRIAEGQRFKVGGVSFTGDLITDEAEFSELIKVDELYADEEYVSTEVVRDDIEQLTNYYNNNGYAYADVAARYMPNEEDGSVGIDYHISKHQRVYIRRVFLEGNTITRDNVIMRALRLGDGDQYRGSGIEASTAMLEALDYFSGVDIEPIPTGDPSEMDLKVAVQEKPTGNIGGGIGYSSSGGAYFAGDLTERNFMGMGYETSLGLQVGGSATAWDFKFWNPRVNDSFWGAGATTSYTKKDKGDYDKNSLSFGAQAAHSLGKATLMRLNYNADVYEITDIEDDASDSIKDEEGGHFESSFGLELNRSTLRRGDFYVREGTSQTAGVTMAGGALGGTDEYIRWTYNGDLYEPLVGELVFHIKGSVGYIHENIGGKDIPTSQRYYLGGQNSVRGYTASKIAPRDSDGAQIGGNKYLATNLELTYPIDKEFGVLGLLFFDAGNAWKEGDFFFASEDKSDITDEKYGADPSGGVYKSFGGGIRWMSPMGPMRFEYGVALDELYESGGTKFEFGMGQAF